MSEMGKAMMGTGGGERRARGGLAPRRRSPTRCSTETSMKGARGLLISITAATT